ncbi:MAG: hypothetical protein ACK5OX_19570 [Desertimonas sp.]
MHTTNVFDAYEAGRLPAEEVAALGPDVGNLLVATAVLRSMSLGEVPNALVAVAGGRK